MLACLVPVLYMLSHNLHLIGGVSHTDCHDIIQLSYYISLFTFRISNIYTDPEYCDSQDKGREILNV